MKIHLVVYEKGLFDLSKAPPLKETLTGVGIASYVGVPNLSQ